MATPTYVPLGTITLGSTDSEIVFSSIPASYRDLILIAAIKNTGSGYDNVRVQFNGDTGSNYSGVQVYFSGGSFASNSYTSDNFEGMTSSQNHNSANILQVLDYSASDKHKSSLIRGNTATAENGNRMAATRWANTAAITQMRIYPQGPSFAVGSTFSLYGVN
jgi:hypothetical protein